MMKHKANISPRCHTAMFAYNAVYQSLIMLIGGGKSSISHSNDDKEIRYSLSGKSLRILPTFRMVQAFNCSCRVDFLCPTNRIVEIFTKSFEHLKQVYIFALSEMTNPVIAACGKTVSLLLHLKATLYGGFNFLFL